MDERRGITVALHPRKDLTFVGDKSEVIAFQMQDIILASVYVENGLDTEPLEELLDHLAAFPALPTVLAGDFNIPDLRSERGNLLFERFTGIQDIGVVIPTYPTHILGN